MWRMPPRPWNPRRGSANRGVFFPALSARAFCACSLPSHDPEKTYGGLGMEKMAVTALGLEFILF